jgi:hypothetical protein
MNSEMSCEEKLFFLGAGMKGHVSNIRVRALVIRERLNIRKLNPNYPGNTDEVIAELAQFIMKACDELEEMRNECT